MGMCAVKSSYDGMSKMLEVEVEATTDEQPAVNVLIASAALSRMLALLAM